MNYLVIDLEMCNVPRDYRSRSYKYANETIQIGAVLLDEEFKRIGTLSQYVHPEHGVIDPFIQNLTAEAKCAYSKSSQILKLSEEEIDSNCEKVCIAMDRAFAFLQIRCGVQSLSDVNYKLMIRLIAYIFTNDKWYGSEKVHDIIEAWYWAAIFSGEYDKDQNERFEKNLRSILETLTTKAKKYDWIITLKNNIFETPYFSDCSFLLMEKANEDRIPKEHLAKYICQFYLSRTYSDLIHDDRQINVFSKYKLEKHHIVPVGSVSKIGESTDILRKDKTKNKYGTSQPGPVSRTKRQIPTLYKRTMAN